MHGGGHVDTLGTFERGTMGVVDRKKSRDQLVNGDLWQSVLSEVSDVSAEP